MGRFNMWFSNMMRGRYGTDSLNRALLVLALIMIAINLFLHSRVMNFVAVMLLIYVYCRIFSRNYSARARENQRFLQLTSSIGGRFRRGTRASSGTGGFARFRTKDKTHRVLRCPGCGERLRVPRGIGKININCPHCHTKFIKKV